MLSGSSCVRSLRLAFVSAILIALTASYASANTITVNNTADTGAAGICVLRDAITAANTDTAVNATLFDVPVPVAQPVPVGSPTPAQRTARRSATM